MTDQGTAEGSHRAAHLLEHQVRAAHRKIFGKASVFESG
jgi:hypothetical protein